MPPFRASSMTLEELLAGRHRLKIPGYQRAFSWTSTEVGQLLDDVLTALDEPNDADADYFLGAVVLMEAGDGRTSEPGAPAPLPALEIVDGLQRLVTLTILFAVLRDIAADEDGDVAAAAANCVSACSNADESRPGRPRLELTDDTQGFFRDFVQQPGATSAMPEDDDLSAPEVRLLAVREYLMAALVGESAERRRQLVGFLRTGCHCAVIVARTLDRAHRIFAVINDRGLPLTRGDILRAEILGSVATERRDELTRLWRSAEHRLGGSLEELLSHLRTIEGRSRTRIIDEIRVLVGRSGDAEAFLVSSLLPYASILAAIRSPQEEADGLPADVNRCLGYLGWLGSHDWVPPLMLYWRRVEGEAEHLVPFLRRLERLAYGLRLLGVGLDKRTSRYRALIEAIRSGALNETGGPLELTRDELRLIRHNLRALHVRSQLACKLVLLRLNDAIAGSPQHLSPSELTVEHVLPQKPGRNSEWRRWFPSADERERCTQSLGNLILVPRHKNEEARNSEFSRKLAIYFDGRTQLPLITRDIDGRSEWRPEDIWRREDRLLGALEELWEIGGARTKDSPMEEPIGARSVKDTSTPRLLLAAMARR